ncbi:hypothetical protein YC2023_067272 [Brassica napus]
MEGYPQGMILDVTIFQTLAVVIIIRNRSPAASVSTIILWIEARRLCRRASENYVCFGCVFYVSRVFRYVVSSQLPRMVQRHLLDQQLVLVGRAGLSGKARH